MSQFEVHWIPVAGCSCIGIGVGGFLACVLPSWAFWLVVALAGWVLLRMEAYQRWLASKEGE